MVCESVPTTVSGKANSSPSRFLVVTTWRQVFQIDLMDDAGHRRNNTEIREYLLPPFEKFIAFMVALEFHFCIALEGIRIGEEIHLHRVVNDQVDRHERVD